MESSKSTVPGVSEPSSDEKDIRNSQNNKNTSAPKVLVNEEDTSVQKKLSSIPINITEPEGTKMDSKSLLGVPKQSSLNSLQVNQIPMGSSTGNPRNKIALRPGYSLMDWIRLTKTPGKNLSGVGGRYTNVTTTELKKHSSRENAWMAINGLVFNVTGNLFD